MGERQGTVEESTFVNRTVLYAAEYAVGEPASNQRAWRAISAGPQRGPGESESDSSRIAPAARIIKIFVNFFMSRKIRIYVEFNLPNYPLHTYH